jgi:hypothetical protein
MPARRLVRTVYSWASEVGALRAPLQTVRSHPRVRAFARRHVAVLLARGTTWANVDGALRLLAEDREQRVVFGPWRGDVATELLYWAPFVRWAQEHFSLDPARVAVVSRGDVGHWYGGACDTYLDTDEFEDDFRGAAVFPPEPVLALVEQYRTGLAAPRPLLKRSKHLLLEPPADAESRAPADGYVAVDLAPSSAFPEADVNRTVAEEAVNALSAAGPVVSVDRGTSWRARHAVLAGATGLVTVHWDLALLGAFSGAPVVVFRSSEPSIPEPDLDLALRITGALGGSLTVLDGSDFRALQGAIGGR